MHPMAQHDAPQRPDGCFPAGRSFSGRTAGPEKPDSSNRAHAATGLTQQPGSRSNRFGAAIQPTSVERTSVEDNSAVPVQQHAALGMPLHRMHQGAGLDVAPHGHELLGRAGMADPDETNMAACSSRPK